MSPFDHEPRTRLVFGPGTLAHTPEIVRALPAHRVLLVTDPGVVRAGHAERLERALDAAGLDVRLFADTREDPTEDDVARCLEVARDVSPDALVALGGGSAIDTAKGTLLRLDSGGDLEGWWRSHEAPTTPLRPLVAVPTTAGTGSEVQSAALVSRNADHRKMAILAPGLAPRAAVLDPELTATMPLDVAARTGLDAVTHAVEAAVTKARTPLSDLYARESFRLGHAALERVLATPPDPGASLDARSRMLLASTWAGLAVENSMLGSAHAAGNPLTARFRVPHGLAVGALLPAVVERNGRDPATRALYAALARAGALAGPDTPDDDAFRALVSRLRTLVDLTGARTALARVPGLRESLPALARDAAEQWTARFNPVPVAAADFETLYREALRG